MNFLGDRGTLVLGHRGSPNANTENTISGLCAAVYEGADGVELDVQLCATGEVVVFHDTELSRLADRGGTVATLAWETLRRVELVGGGHIPSLAEVLDALPTCLVNVEIKKPRFFDLHRTVRAVVAVAEASPHRILYSSFDPRVIGLLRAVAPDVDTGYLFHAGQALPFQRGLPAWALRPSAVHPEQLLVDAAEVNRWHSAGFAVATWTVDDLQRAQQLAGWGVDIIITNEPAAVARHLKDA